MEVDGAGSGAILGVQEKEIPARYLRTFGAWNGARHTSPKEARLAAETLLDAARNGDEDAADAGIEFIVFLLMRTSDSEDKLEWLQTVFHDKSLDVVFGLLEQSTIKHGSSLSGFQAYSPVRSRRTPIVLCRS